jgi:hypothetical protein
MLLLLVYYIHKVRVSISLRRIKAKPRCVLSASIVYPRLSERVFHGLIFYALFLLK